MNISDLNYCEEVAEAASVVGGSNSLEVEVNNNEITKLNSSGYKVVTQQNENGISITATPEDSSVATISIISISE
ncbi:MAG: hypothetical protein N4J56_003158 [Chroococcidiopsis sp. SAG 2025]|uniref:hypothetical protein n=1 Tax=Chroococcidiopsis sp. SAG 2025 TaxID=171389 RepID=UPI0029372759|nr:hypothetical protein [Chroococcidiopsis sp. SAG 2025]MDV2993504.1 hypothetical protein [Chroococcidiopsis sp. SAG 2025]